MNKKRDHSRKAAETCGQAGVEFALVLPLLLLILFGTIEYGWYFTLQYVLNHAVTEGVRAGVAARPWEDEDPEEQACIAILRSFWLNQGGNSDSLDTHISTDIVANNTLRMLEVSVTDWTYRPITGFLIPPLIPQHLNAKAVMALPK
ncbi:MAG: pilus assembly protein [Desulfatitalea sp.]|nr:pilus assembly protein [Desulfatitalea sp.]NNK00476.1 pilus assembly protein [Desulfatitalea sp.]